jgi:hypothetical protein
MKKIIIILISFFLANHFLTGQIVNERRQPKIYSISIAPIYEGNVMTIGGFDKLNEILKAHNLYTIRNEFKGGGISFCFTNRKNKGGMEFSYLNLGSYLYDSTDQTTRQVLPFLSGSNLRVAYFRKLFETNRWYGTAALGLSFINLNFKLIDGGPQIFSLDSLISNPNLTPTLDLRQSKNNLAMDFHTGIYFKTKWLKKAFDDFDIGIKFGYVHTFRSGEKWIANGTLNNFLVKDLPEMKLNNVYFQMSFLFKYNFL